MPTFELPWASDPGLRVEDVATIETWNRSAEAHGRKVNGGASGLGGSAEHAAGLPAEMVVQGTEHGVKATSNWADF